MSIPVVILCGGTGTRLKEQTEFIPKPLIPIGPYPMVVHIMKLYAHYGFKEFVLALGYKQEAFKQYFTNFNLINDDVTVVNGKGWLYREGAGNDWTVTLSNTGENTMKGGRLKRVERYITGNTFMMTYGDGIGDINIPELLDFHRSHGKLATVTGVHPAPRFGEIHHNKGDVISFSEKPVNDGCLMNGGFFVFNRGIFDYLIDDEQCDLEVGPLELIAAKGELRVYHHKGMWRCMDNLREMSELQQMWKEGKARWKIW